MIGLFRIRGHFLSTIPLSNLNFILLLLSREGNTNASVCFTTSVFQQIPLLCSGYKEHTYKTLAIRDPIYCAAKCDTHVFCEMFSWNPTNRLCSLIKYFTVNHYFEIQGCDKKQFYATTQKSNCRYDLGYRKILYYYKGGKFDPHKTVCMKAVVFKMTYVQAASSCKKDGGRLLKADSRALIDASFNLMSIHLAKLTDFYIGLDDRDQEGMFKWSDGTIYDYQNSRSFFIRNNPDNYLFAENCVHVLSNRPHGYAELNDVPCNLKSPFVCEISISDY